MKKELKEVIDEEQFDSIVLYRLPYQNDCKIILGTSEEIVNGINGLHLRSDGFVFEPFDNTSCNGIFIDSLFSATFQKIPADQKELISDLFITSSVSDSVYEDDYQSYLSNFNKMHDALDNDKLSKVILSRALKGPQIKKNHIVDIFENLAAKYPHAFVYAISSPDKGTWIGAGPELLLKNQSGNLSTVSLAGTLPNEDQYRWTGKEITEQLFVTEYIENVLLHHQAQNIEYSQPKSVNAGQVKHLCTNFRFGLSEINGNHIGLLYDLHPTPAVCGLPKEEAYQLILETEKHDRQFYSGFLGPVTKGSYEFYVNIRCLKVTEDQCVLFIGGGLTKDSEAKKEWLETELKAQTLLSVLRNI
ncbi:isochorismate synthase [Carboxylicivirga taeanensis]|uniref:isochorismate synthase n=1 Tax=Carboxylicivirga taeanensis TaxID=1416875 RepID=UPI003F6DCB37